MKPMPLERAPSRMPPNVATLGLVSLLMAASSQMTNSLLPLYLVTVMGASTATVGLIEGLAEATNSCLRAVSGVISDWIGRRKPLVVFGYALSACVKPVFPLAGSIPVILAARLFDRTGKGIRDAPRDALLADQLSSRVRGSGFGLRISFFTAGTVLGPMLAAAIMAASAHDFRLVFWIAVIPAALSVIVLVARVEETPRSAPEPKSRLDWRSLTVLPSAYWSVVAVACIIALARFSQAFLLLKANAIGVRMAHVPVYLALVGLVYGVSAYPFGVLADRMDRRIQLGMGVATLALSHVVLAFSDTGSVLVLGTLLWGLQLGIIDGLLGASVADTTPEKLRGTGFGVYYSCVGLASLIASATAGLLWQTGGAAVTFSVGAGIAATALLCVVVARSSLPAFTPHPATA
jgi:MFS family permease